MSWDRPILAATSSPRSLPPLQRVLTTLVKNSLFWGCPKPMGITKSHWVFSDFGYLHHRTLWGWHGACSKALLWVISCINSTLLLWTKLIFWVIWELKMNSFDLAIGGHAIFCEVWCLFGTNGLFRHGALCFLPLLRPYRGSVALFQTKSIDKIFIFKQ